MTGWIQALFQTNRDREAEDLSWQLIRTGPADSPAYDLLYGHYANNRQWADAERVLRAKVQRNPGKPEYVLQLAGFYADRSRRDAMEQALETLHDPKRFARGRLAAGDFYAARSLWDEALHEYEAGAQANPAEAVSYWRRIADAWLAQEKPEKASEAVKKILQVSPDDDNAKAVKAALLVAGGNPKDLAAGTAEFQRLVEKNPSSATWHYALGKALAAQGDPDGGREPIEQALHLQPNFVPARIALAELSQARGDYQSALRQADEVLNDGVERPAARLVHAVSLMYSGKTPQARAELVSLEKAYPQERRVRLQLAWLDLEEKKFAAALSLLADTALRMRQADLAIAQYRKLAAMEPTGNSLTSD